MAVSERLIPACAGNITFFVLARLRMAAHPRVCGEHFRFVIDGIVKFGSSPRVRGTLLEYGDKDEDGRLIPACAGNIELTRLEFTLTTAHPRVCGEHRDAKFAIAAASGSSPRVRGTC